MFAHRIIGPLRQLQRKQASLAYFPTHFADQLIEPVVSAHLGDEAMKLAVRFKVSLQIFFAIGQLEQLVQVA